MIRPIALPTCILLVLAAAAPAQNEAAAAFPGKQSIWQGFQRYDFEFAERPVTVVAPAKAADGKPWLWRGEFFGAFPSVDLALLKQGWHVVYVACPNTFGSLDTMARWQRVYDELTRHHGFSKRPVLLGMSRGGLYVYRWASMHPDQVGLIYGDAPVCDVKSWPGGKGKGTGSPREWELFQKVFGLNEQQALAWKQNPVDILKPIARAHIPIIHVVGDVDEAVPMEENTTILKQRYEALGGHVELIVKPGVGHHPHSLSDPTPIVDYILKHRLTGRKACSEGKQAAAVLRPRIAGDWVHVYVPKGDVFPGPDSALFKAGQRYEDWQPNDHMIIKGPDGRWHAFGITHPSVRPGEPNAHDGEWQLFHAAAPAGKLKQHLTKGAWQDYEKILPPAARPGEIHANHSPAIVLRNGLYTMIYGHSPIRYATSPDLWHWTPRGPLFSQEGGARDPSILFHKGLYYMSYTSRLSVMVRTSSDLLKWSEPTTVYTLAAGQTGGPESPTILALKGGFYLIWCRWDAELSRQNLHTYQDRSFVYYSDDPLNFRDREPVAEIQGHAPELFQDEDGDWWISSAERPFRGVSIAPIRWEKR